MEEFTLLAPLLLAVAGLMIGAILKSILGKTGLPYTVGLFVFGIAIGLLNRFEVLDAYPAVSKALNSVGNIEPDFILYVFLPILIFDAAYEMNLHIFRKTLANATLLAAPGLVFSMFLTACLVIGISMFAPDYEEWTWPFALMFGALISATDPVAVVALLHELGTSKRFSTLVDGESLLNDGTGIVCFMLFFGAYTAAGVSDVSPFVQFIEVVAGGAILGFILARISIWFITRINSEEMIQNSVIILSAYITFIISQYFMGVSGVIALVAFGLTVAYVGKPRLKPEVNFFMEKFWELLSHIANTLIFIMVGVLIAEKVAPGWTDVLILIIIYIGLNIIRFTMIMLLYPVMKRMGYGLTKRESVILTWGGLRGALAMVLALMVSYAPGIPDDIRRQILFFTAGTVTLTLSINATTMHWLLERLGLTNVTSARTLMKYRIHTHIREQSESYFEKLQTRESMQNANWDKVRKYLPAKPSAPEKHPQDNDFMAEIRLRVLDKEKANCRNFYDDGIISKSSFLHIMNSLDELYDHDGKFPLNKRDSIFEFCDRSFLYSYADKTPAAMREWISFYFKERIMITHDMGKGFILIQRESIKVINDLQISNLIDEKQKALLDELKKEVEENISKMNTLIEKLAESFPKAYRYAITQKSIRMLLSNEKHTIKQLMHEGIISEKDANILMESVNEKSDEVNSFSHTIPASILRWTFGMRKSEKQHDE